MALVAGLCLLILVPLKLIPQVNLLLEGQAHLEIGDLELVIDTRFKLRVYKIPTPRFKWFAVDQNCAILMLLIV